MEAFIIFLSIPIMVIGTHSNGGSIFFFGAAMLLIGLLGTVRTIIKLLTWKI